MTLENLLRSKKLIFVLLLVATFVVFGNTFLNEWTYDDIPVVLQNPDVRSLDNFVKDSYSGRPLRELSYMLDYTLFGENPVGYRIQQHLWHAANGCLLFLVLSMLGISPGYALIGALFFLVHPLQVETVASIGHRKELLPLFFGFLVILGYARSFMVSGAQRWLMWLGCAVSYVLVLMGNLTAGTLPLLLPVYEMLFVEKDKRVLMRYPLLCIGGVLASVATCVYLYFDRFDFQQALLKSYVQNGFTGEQGYLPMFWAVFKVPFLYLGKVLWPVSLAPEYVVSFSADKFQLAGALGIVLLIIMLVLAWRLRKKLPVVSFAIVWIVVMYIPVANLLPVYAYAMADRYMYMVMPGFALIVSAILQKLASKQLVLMSVVILVGLSTLTVVQNSYWRNEYSLWSHAVKVSPDSKGAVWSMAVTRREAGELEEAKRGFERVLELDRFFVMANLELAKILERQGNLSEAKKHYETFVRYGRFKHPVEAQRVDSYLKFRFQ